MDNTRIIEIEKRLSNATQQQAYGNWDVMPDGPNIVGTSIEGGISQTAEFLNSGDAILFCNAFKDLTYLVNRVKELEHALFLASLHINPVEEAMELKIVDDILHERNRVK